MKKIRERSFSHKKVALFILAMSFVWLQISNANDSEHNYFEDRDQDGLTDQEELALGTDPDNADTDGDGYSDGVEVESGYDPLVASPDDRVVDDTTTEVQDSSENDVNLTDEFLENFEETNSEEIAAIQLMASDPVQFEDQLNSGELEDVNLTEDEIKALFEQTVEEVDIEDEVTELSDEEINILEPVEGDDAEEVLAEEKKQVEEYFIQVGYILFEAAPFAIEDEEDVSEGVTSLIGEVSEDIGEGDVSNIVELESTGKNVYEQVKALEVPYVLKDIHKTGLALLSYSLDQNESAVFDEEDPLEMVNLVGKVQGMMSEVDLLQDNVFNLFAQYGIDEFMIPDDLEL